MAAIYKEIPAVLKVETDIITSIAVSLIARSAITSDNVRQDLQIIRYYFYRSPHNVFDTTLTNKFQY